MTAKSAAEVPGPRLPRLLQTLLGVMRPLEARLGMRGRYGSVFRSNDAIVAIRSAAKPAKRSAGKLFGWVRARRIDCSHEATSAWVASSASS